MENTTFTINTPYPDGFIPNKKQPKKSIIEIIKQLFVRKNQITSENDIRQMPCILNDANKTNELQTLISLWNEIATNKYKYSLNDIIHARNHLMELVLKSNGSDIEIGKFYIYLKNQI